MKKILLLTGVLLALTASLASAGNLDMSWNGCPLTLTNPSDVSDPCDNNFGNYVFVLSVKAPAALTKWVGEELNLDVATAGPVLPDWWHLEAFDPNQITLSHTFAKLRVSSFTQNLSGPLSGTATLAVAPRR